MAALTLLLCRLYEVLTDMVAYGNLSVPKGWGGLFRSLRRIERQKGQTGRTASRRRK